MISLALTLTLLSQVDGGLDPSFGVLSIRNVLAETSSKGQPGEFTVIELEGQLDLVFSAGDAVNSSLFVGDSPCTYVRDTAHRGWCIISRKVDTKSERIAGPFRMIGNVLLGPRGPDVPAKSLAGVRLQPLFRVPDEGKIASALKSRPGAK